VLGGLGVGGGGPGGYGAVWAPAGLPVRATAPAASMDATPRDAPKRVVVVRRGIGLSDVGKAKPQPHG
jgi:hypothetical protein